jgi:hypothetical protein
MHLREVTGGFMMAPTRGIIGITLLDAHHDSHGRYVSAIAARMRPEYDDIHGPRLLPLDAPDLPRAAVPARS